MTIKLMAVFQIIFFLIALLIIFLLIRYTKKVKKYKQMFEKTLSKFNSEKGIKNEFLNLYDRIDKLENNEENIKNQITVINEKNKKAINNIKVLKYNAYDEAGSKLSFALAMINEENNGILFNEIHSKHGSNMYVKEINNGTVKERVSNEEQQVIENACNKEENK